MSTLEVCLVRHGQSVSNAAGVWQGQGDSPLSDIGRTQVASLLGVKSTSAPGRA
ncbi:MAG: histidine phosphatase family protein [Deltaproteobacteria bacterium]|nr:histidine phosphatase family protein [Deltaproteobacteria bacterium]